MKTLIALFVGTAFVAGLAGAAVAQTTPPAEKKTLWAWLIGTFFGAGLLQPGPGTYGSIAAVLLWYAAAHILHPRPAALRPRSAPR